MRKLFNLVCLLLTAYITIHTVHVHALTCVIPDCTTTDVYVDVVLKNQYGDSATKDDFLPHIMLNASAITDYATPQAVEVGQMVTFTDTPLYGYTTESIVCKNNLTDMQLKNGFTTESEATYSCVITYAGLAPELNVTKSVYGNADGTEFTLYMGTDEHRVNADETANFLPMTVGTVIFGEKNVPPHWTPMSVSCLATDYLSEAVTNIDVTYLEPYDVSIPITLGQVVNCTFINGKNAQVDVYVFNDSNVNGLQDTGEVLLDNRTVTAHSVGDATYPDIGYTDEDTTTSTDPAHFEIFDETLIEPGLQIAIDSVQPEGWTHTSTFCLPWGESTVTLPLVLHIGDTHTCFIGSYKKPVITPPEPPVVTPPKVTIVLAATTMTPVKTLSNTGSDSVVVALMSLVIITCALHASRQKRA